MGYVGSIFLQVQRAVRRWEDTEPNIRYLSEVLGSTRVRGGELVDGLVEQVLGIETVCDDFSATLGREVEESLLAGDELLPEPILTTTDVGSQTSSSGPLRTVQPKPVWNDRFSMRD
jgi:hypothetical protein